MDEIRIKSLEELKDWNLNPTDKVPIVMEWFYDWIFDVINQDKLRFGFISKSNFNLFVDAYKTNVEFTMICEKLSIEDSLKRCEDNIRYVYGRFSKRCPKFRKYMEKLQKINYGFLD